MREHDIAPHARAISPFLAMEVLERAVAMDAAGDPVIHLEVGEPDFPTPHVIVEAVQRALKDGRTKYTHSQGTLELREAICEHYAARYKARVTPDRVIVTAGSSPAIWMVFSALLEPGDAVILPNPHYACYPNFVRFCRGEPVYVDVREDEGFRLDPSAVREKCGPRTKAILVNSPANPTGAVLPAATLGRLAQLGPPVISGEIYHGLTYEGEEHSILEYSAVCAAGADTVPLPGDVSEQQIARILGDVAWLAYRWNKPLAARLLPAPGRRAGDLTEFPNQALTNTVVQPLPGSSR